MSSDYVRVTITAFRGREPGEPTNDELKEVLMYADCGELDRVLADIRSVEVEDISREEAWPADWGPYEPDSPDEDETPSWAIDAQQDEREAGDRT